jgi:FixJ family two-component response regulator
MVRRGAVDRRGLASGGELKSQATTVFLVDDDPGVVRDLSRSLRTAGHNVRRFRSSRDFLAEHDLTTPGCAVLGFTMPGLSGLELQNALATSGNQRPIIFMSRNADIASGVQAMKRGAVDFLTKPVKERALLAAVQHAIERDRQMREIWAELRSIAGHLATLTPRELEVFHHLVSGRRNKQIAQDLGTVEKTIKVHRCSVMKKMGARSLPDLVRMAI